MSRIETSAVASDEGRVCFTGSPNVKGNVNLDQSNNKIEIVNVNYVPSIQHDGIVRAFNFDLESLQREGVIASRVDELKEIRSKLGQVTKTGTKVAILKGIGGSGKTTLAKLYAVDERSREPFVNLVWIDAEDSNKVVDNFQQLSKKISSGMSNLIGRRLADAVYNFILRHKTLIVFDNVESFRDISDFLPTIPQPPYPQFIITTRNELEMPGYRNHWVHVNVLSLEVSRFYIREKLETSQLRIPDIAQNSEELATYFGRLVIALRAATSSVIQQNEKQQFWDEDQQQVYTIKMYLSEIKQVDILHVNDSNSNDPAEITYKPLRQIWTKTLDDLANRPQNLTVQLAERILQVLAFLSPTGVPEGWFRTLLQSFLDSNEMSLTTEMNADARCLLASMSLVEQSGGKLVIHRLLQTTLLSRLNGAPHLKFESLNWLLPAISKLYSRLRKDNRLQNFNSNMDHLFISIRRDLLEDVPNLAVPFLAQLNQPSTESCKKLLKKLIRSVFKERVLLSRDNLNLLVTSPTVVDSVLLIPMWLRECGENVSIGEQLGLVKKILNLKVTGWRAAYPFDVDGAGSIYIAIAEVLAKWEPGVETNQDNFEVAQNAISLVKRLCKILSKAMESKQLCPKSCYRILNPVFSKLKKCLVTALTVIFSQRATKSQNVETMFNSVLVAVRWYLTLEEFESSFETKPSKTLNLSQLDDILSQTGVDRSTVEIYEAQLQCCYSTFGSMDSMDSIDSTDNDRKEQIQLEARIAASFSAILTKCSSDGQENEMNLSTLTVAGLRLQGGSDVPLEVIPLLEALANWDHFWLQIFPGVSVLQYHLLCKGLEPHLQTLKTNFQIDDDSDQCEGGFLSFSKALKKISYHHNGTLLGFFEFFFEDRIMKMSPQTAAIMFPNWYECLEVHDDIVERFKQIESSLESLSFFIEELEDFSNPRQLVETFEVHYIGRTSCDRSKLGEILRKASVLIRDPTNTPGICDCLVSRCQRMLAGLSLEKGNTEDAIAEASKAFEHQLYCAESYLHLVGTVQVLLDAYREFEDAQASSKKLLCRVITEHKGGIAVNYSEDKRVQPTLLSQSRLMRYLCSVGSLQEAAEVGENFGFGLPQSFSDKFGQNLLDLDGLLIVALFLILSGDSDQAIKTLECDHLNRKFTDQDYYRYYYFGNDTYAPHIEVVSNERSTFLLALKQIAASISSDSELPSEFNISCFRKGVFAYLQFGYTDGDEIWDCVADKQHRKKLFKTTKRKTWCEKRFGNGKLRRDMLALLWFDTMDTLIFQKRKLLDETLFTRLERHLKVSDTGRHFKWADPDRHWGIKCLLGMYRRQELWFQKAELHCGVVDQAGGGAEAEKAHKHKCNSAANTGSKTLVKRGTSDRDSSKGWFRFPQVSLGLSKRK